MLHARGGAGAVRRSEREGDRRRSRTDSHRERTPARRASVRMLPPTGGVPLTATADLDGRYEFTEVRAGDYRISAGKPGYVALEYGQQRAFEHGTVVAVPRRRDAREDRHHAGRQRRDLGPRVRRARRSARSGQRQADAAAVRGEPAAAAAGDRRRRPRDRRSGRVSRLRRAAGRIPRHGVGRRSVTRAVRDDRAARLCAHVLSGDAKGVRGAGDRGRAVAGRVRDRFQAGACRDRLDLRRRHRFAGPAGTGASCWPPASAPAVSPRNRS